MDVKTAVSILNTEKPFLCMEEIPDIEGYKTWSLTWCQFRQLQGIISGAGFGETLQENIDFFIGRGVYLYSQVDESGPMHYPAMGYCNYGYLMDDDSLHMWYETTRGTILSISTNGDETFYQVHLPEDRLGGFHHREIDYVLSGRTSEQYERWYNCQCFDDRETEYREYSEFHNRHMVPRGYAKVHNLEEFKISRQIDNAIQCVHGDWSTKYGIGPNIDKIIGFDYKIKPSAEEKKEAAAAVLRELEQAAERWQKLLNEWGIDENTLNQYEYYDDDDDAEAYEDYSDEDYID